ncbi:unnamed protein product [Cochlearia groenlandica]
MDDDNDLWGPPLLVLKDALCKQRLGGCEFWFDYRTDVLEECYQNKRYCEKVWLILSDYKKLERDSVSVQNHLVASSESVAEDVDSSSSHVLVSNQVSENKFSSPISCENQQRDSLGDIVTVSEPFTTESLLEMCDDEPEKNIEASCNEISKSHLEARHKIESNSLLDDHRHVLVKKRQRESNNNSEDKDMKTKQKKVVQGESNRDSLVDLGYDRSEKDGYIVRDLAVSRSELKKKTGKELKNIAKAMKVTHYYKLKKEDLLHRLTTQLSP